MGGDQGSIDPFGLNFYGGQQGLGSLGRASASGLDGIAASPRESSMYSWEKFVNPSETMGISTNDLWGQAKRLATEKAYASSGKPRSHSGYASGRVKRPTVSRDAIETEFRSMYGPGLGPKTPTMQTPPVEWVNPMGGNKKQRKRWYRENLPGQGFQYQSPEARGVWSDPTPFGYSAGGIVDAMPAPEAYAQEEMESGMQSFQLPEMDAGMKSRQSIVENAILAISNPAQHPNPEMARLDFVEAFGESAYAKLESRVLGRESSPSPEGGLVEQGFNAGGPVPVGDGMSDSVPANIDGVEPVALSEGEFVVPADVVSGLGNGSTNAGAQRLSELMANVRQSRTGTTSQAPPINAKAMVG
jgi:hypothetical protein